MQCCMNGVLKVDYEPYTPWLMAAEKEIKELKNDSVRNLTKSCAQKRLWDDCLEPESYIGSNAAHII